jgi:hypothetical protein
MSIRPAKRAWPMLTPADKMGAIGFVVYSGLSHAIGIQLATRLPGASSSAQEK